MGGGEIYTRYKSQPTSPYTTQATPAAHLRSPPMQGTQHVHLPPDGGVGENYTRYKPNPHQPTEAYLMQGTQHAHLPPGGLGENCTRCKLSSHLPKSTQAHPMQNTQHAHLPPNGRVGKIYTRHNLNSSEHLIPSMNLFWHAHVRTTLPNIYTAPPTNPHHTRGIPKQICLAVTQVCLAAHLCSADNTTTENTLTCPQDLGEEGSSRKGTKATAKAPALENLEVASEDSHSGQRKGENSKETSTTRIHSQATTQAKAYCPRDQRRRSRR